MIRPERAPVRPRVISPETQDAVLLEDIVLEADKTARWTIQIVGEPGSGKTMALAHIAAVTPADRGLAVLDDPRPAEVAQAAMHGLVVFTSSVRRPLPRAVTYQLAPWGEDELLEYLLAAHPAKCGAVMARLQAGGQRAAPGPPEVWRAVLDCMAEAPGVLTVADALRGAVERGLSNPYRQAHAEQYCLASLLGKFDRTTTHYQAMTKARAAEQIVRLLRHAPVQLVLAADALASLVGAGLASEWLQQRLPRELIKVAGSRLSPGAIADLTRLSAEKPIQCQPVAASLLHATGTGWVPPREPPPLLSGAYLEGAQWPSVNLRRANIDSADLSNSDLAGANLEGAAAWGAKFQGARLQRASLARIMAGEANFAICTLVDADIRYAMLQIADLTRADLSSARLADADLTKADLKRALLHDTDLKRAILNDAAIAGADFTSADLRWSTLSGLPLREAQFAAARFAYAHLEKCDLEGMELPEADFEEADLTEAYLTGSRMPRANFRGADLHGAGLADIQWEEADLRNADLRRCTFHLGSTRSGLVGSPIACEGSRTGFYGDDFDNQAYRPPEEIRKANLCRADLRGAQYDAPQREHFLRCGAILFDRQ